MPAGYVKRGREQMRPRAHKRSGNVPPFACAGLPPVRGYADANSAQMSAPQSVSAPAAMPATEGIWRVISDGWTKIDAPTIVPTTIAVACVSPRERRREAVTARFALPTRMVPWQADGRRPFKEGSIP